MPSVRALVNPFLRFGPSAFPKAEIVPRPPQEVPFAPAVGDSAPMDESHILYMQK